MNDNYIYSFANFPYSIIKTITGSAGDSLWIAVMSTHFLPLLVSPDKSTSPVLFNPTFLQFFASLKQFEYSAWIAEFLTPFDAILQGSTLPTLSYVSLYFFHIRNS